MRIEEVTISNFRGFCEERKIPMAADVVIVRGPNGSGKTSFLDAIQWLLLADVQRLSLGTLKPKEDYLSNRYASGPPFVEAKLRSASGNSARVTRRGLGEAMQVQVDLDGGEPLIGDAAQHWLNEAMGAGQGSQDRIDFLRRYLLQQDDMREFLGANTKERYQFIAALTGMERLTNLEKQMAEELSAARRKVKELKGDLEKAAVDRETVRETVSRARELVAPRTEIPGAVAAEARAEKLLGDRSDDQVAALRSKAADLSEATDRLAELKRREVRCRVELRERGEAPVETIVSLEAGIEEAAGAVAASAHELAVLNSALSEAQAASDNAQQLAALALTQIEGPCPVCQQEHVVEHTRSHLQQLLAGSPELQALTETVEAKRRKHDELQRELVDKRSQLSDLQGAVEERLQLEGLLVELGARVADEEKRVASLIPTGMEYDDPGMAGEEARRELERAAASLEGIAHAQVQSRQAERRVVAVEQQESTRQKRYRDLAMAVSQAEDRVDKASEARSALGRRINDVMAHLSNSSSGLINAIYSRLDIHPTFREFEFRTDRYREGGHLRPWVCDRRRGKDGNALHVLSAAQLNSLAICLFLALNLERDSDLRTAILDDPVQSLDDVNLLSLADVLRTVRDRRQIVVSTHDEVLAELLIRKLRPLREKNATAVVTIDQWGEAGPRVTTEMRSAIELEPEFQLLAAAI